MINDYSKMSMRDAYFNRVYELAKREGIWVPVNGWPINRY